MEHYGFTSILALKTPQKPFTGSDLKGSVHHPEFFKFSYEPTGRSAVIAVNWLSPKTRAVSFSHFDRIWESETPAEPLHFPQITDWLGRSLALPRE
jgi:hypothetical protein